MLTVLTRFTAHLTTSKVCGLSGLGAAGFVGPDNDVDDVDDVVDVGVIGVIAGSQASWLSALNTVPKATNGGTWAKHDGSFLCDQWQVWMGKHRRLGLVLW